MNWRKILVGQFVLATVVAICLGGCAPPQKPAKQKRSDTTTTPDEKTTPASEATAPGAGLSPEPIKTPQTPAEKQPATEPMEQKSQPTEAAPDSAKAAPEPSAAPPAKDPAETTPGKPAGEPQPENPAPPAKDQATSTPNSGKPVASGDWPMWAGTIHRNMYNPTTGISLDFQPAEDVKKGKHLLWVSPLGSQTYGNPVVAQGKVYVGTNNGGNYRPKHKGDRGVVLCFDEKTGKFLWQLTREKLPQGRVNDWP